MFIRRAEYFVVAALFAVLAIVSAVVMALSLDTGIVAPGRRALNKSDDIVARAGALVSVSDSEVKIAKSRVSDGLVSCGDYVISVMTSPDYLLNGVSDDRFAEDLCNVVFGEVKQDEKNDVLRRCAETDRCGQNCDRCKQVIRLHMDVVYHNWV